MAETNSLSEFDYEILSEDGDASSTEHLGSEMCVDILEKSKTELDSSLKHLCDSVYDRVYADLMDTFMDSDRVGELEDNCSQLESNISLLKEELERSITENEELRSKIHLMVNERSGNYDSLRSEYDELHEAYNSIRYELELEKKESNKLLNDFSMLSEKSKQLEYTVLMLGEDENKYKKEIQELKNASKHREKTILELQTTKEQLVSGVNYLERQNSVLEEDSVFLERILKQKELEIENLKAMLESEPTNTSNLDVLADVCTNELEKVEGITKSDHVSLKLQPKCNNKKKNVIEKGHRYNLRSRKE